MKGEYSNREIDHMMKDIRETLERIEAQTTKTNGRVTALEKWMWTISGAIAILSFLVGSRIIDIIKQ